MTRNVFPDWVQINFAAAKNIPEIDVYTPQDTTPLDPRDHVDPLTGLVVNDAGSSATMQLSTFLTARGSPDRCEPRSAPLPPRRVPYTGCGVIALAFTSHLRFNAEPLSKASCCTRR